MINLKSENGLYKITLTVNGSAHELHVAAHQTLLWVLREQLDITGPKECCGIGECGACTILLDGKAVNSCLILAVEADGTEIITVEGLGGENELDPIQRALIDYGAVQCGFCTPGMVMAAKYLLDNNPSPSEAEIREALAGNLCRCTGYARIIQAIKSLSQ